MDLRRRFLVISPVRDEAAFLKRTIDSVVAQTVRPTLWLIVDDGSTDETPAIAARAAATHAWIRLHRRPRRGERRVGGGVVEAFHEGLALCDADAFEYVCKLDGDLELPPGYFARVLAQMEREPRLGNFSGKVWLRRPDGRLVPERMGDENAIGAAKFYRVACFRDIGGFVPGGCWDGIDGHRCRMTGWMARSVDDPELRIVHLRPMGSSVGGLWRGRQRWGRGKWFMGSAWYYVLAVALYRMAERPYVLGGLGILTGYVRALLSGAPRYADPAFRRFLRRYERAALLRGKRRVTQLYDEQLRTRHPPPLPAGLVSHCHRGPSR